MATKVTNTLYLVPAVCEDKSNIKVVDKGKKIKKITKENID